MLVNSSSLLTLTFLEGATGLPSLNHSTVRGRSPSMTVQMTRTRFPRVRFLGKVNDSISGATVFRKQNKKKKVLIKHKKRCAKTEWLSARLEKWVQCDNNYLSAGAWWLIECLMCFFSECFCLPLTLSICECNTLPAKFSAEQVKFALCSGLKWSILRTLS